MIRDMLKLVLMHLRPRGEETVVLESDRQLEDGWSCRVAYDPAPVSSWIVRSSIIRWTVAEYPSAALRCDFSFCM